MDTEDERRPLGDRRTVVCGARLVRCPHLAQHGAGLRHDVRHAEPSADLDELAARHDDFPSRRESGEDQQRRRRVVVDDDGSFGAGQAAEHRFGVDVSAAARPPAEVVLER